MLAQEDELRRKALVGTIHYSTLIEGNELPIIEAERAAQGQLEPTNKAKRELVNYVRHWSGSMNVSLLASSPIRATL